MYILGENTYKIASKYNVKNVTISYILKLCNINIKGSLKIYSKDEKKLLICI